MDADNYQRAAARTLINKPDFELKHEHAAHAQELLDFAASVGAIAEYIKKGIFHQHGFSDGELYKLYHKAMRNDDTRGVPWMDDAMVMMVWNVIGLIGEVGKVARLVTDAIHSHQPIDSAALQKELGDVEWYTNAIATRGGLSMSAVLAANLDKLRKRYPNGYNAADSVARVDVAGESINTHADQKRELYNYLINRDGQVVNFVDPEQYKAWHAGLKLVNMNASDVIPDGTIDNHIPADYADQLAVKDMFVPAEPGTVVPGDCASSYRLEVPARVVNVDFSNPPRCAGCLERIAHCTCYDDSGGI